MDELLKIVISEYQQMTGLENVTANTKVINSHIEPLKRRLNINDGLLIFKDSILSTIGDYAKAIDIVFVVRNNYAVRVLQVAEVLTGKKYDLKDKLFGDCCLDNQSKYRATLCKKISERYNIKFDENIDTLYSAEDFSDYIFQKDCIEKARI